MAGWWEVRPTLMNFAQYDVSHDILLCRNPFLTVGCHSPFHPDLEWHFNISAIEAMSVVLVFKDCFQRSVWWPTVQREDPDMIAQWARMQENSSLVSDSTPAQSHQGHTVDIHIQLKQICSWRVLAWGQHLWRTNPCRRRRLGVGTLWMACGCGLSRRAREEENARVPCLRTVGSVG